MNVIWTRLAFQRLLEIEEFIARDHPSVAQSHTDRLLFETDKLGDFPKMGRLVPELPAGSLRELIIGNYRIVYRIDHETIHVLTVFESHRILGTVNTNYERGAAVPNEASQGARSEI